MDFDPSTVGHADNTLIRNSEQEVSGFCAFDTQGTEVRLNHRETDRQTDRQIDRGKREGNRQTERKKERDRQPERQTEREGERDGEREGGEGHLLSQDSDVLVQFSHESNTSW